MAENIPPVRRQIVVGIAPDAAFAAFTTDIGTWWPTKGYSVNQGSVTFLDGELVESSPEGRSVWGRVLEWTPPQRFRMTWHPGSDPDTATEVVVRFDEIGDGSRTLVTLEHTGWERLAEPVATRNGYAGGWIGVLGEYESHAGPGNTDGTATDDKTDVWLALSHTPGPDAPADRNVLADPRIREHFGFVSELLNEGVLVGAGPIEGRTGHGMTVIRTSAEHVADYVRRAQVDDPSVAGGLLQVDISVWAVALSP